MSELIPFTPEHGTTPERFYWDAIIRAMEALSNVSDEVDLFAELEDLREVDQEDALIAVFNYLATAIIPEGQTSELDEVMQILADSGLIEPDEQIV